MEVLVEYEYQALHEDELTLHPGDVISGVRRVEEEGWMEGELDGKRGLFPDNFVKELKKESKEEKAEVKAEAKAEVCQVPRREKQPGTVANMVQRMSHILIPTGGFQPPSQTSRKKPRTRQCKVLYDYAPQNQDELELKVGELVDINEEVEEGWWSGSVSGRTGLFPSNFVRELEDEETSDVAMATEETDGKEVADPTSPGPAAGNGVFAPPKKVMGFGFGDIFKEGSVKLRTRPASPDKEERREKPIPSLPSAGKPGPAAPPPSQADSRAQEYCKVTYTFDSTNEDELSLKEDDIIHILSKDTGEPGWWRGEINGKSGVFPDNFVSMVTEADKETPAVRASMSSSSKQESEEKPKKPPPPSKHAALRPDIPSTDRKPQFARSEDKVDLKPSKPAAPLVSKKPLPLPLKNRLSGVPPKRPEKPLTPMNSSPAMTPSTSMTSSTSVTPGTPPPTITRHNGEVGSLRPKSELEPLVLPKPRTSSGDWAEKSSESDLMSFDALSASSEKLSHLTVNRPKMPGRRLPGHSGGQPNKEVEEEQEEAKPRLSDTKKPSMSTMATPPAGFLKPSPGPTEPKGATPPRGDPPSTASRGRLEGEDLGSQMEDMRSQMRDLLMSVDLIRNQQTKEMALLRAELDEERLKRLTLQMEIEKLKKAVQLT